MTRKSWGASFRPSERPYQKKHRAVRREEESDSSFAKVCIVAFAIAVALCILNYILTI